MKKLLSLIFCCLFIFAGLLTLSACGGAASLTDILIDTQNAKVCFVVGENFTNDGLAVGALYSDGTSKEVKDFSSSAKLDDLIVRTGESFTKAGEYKVSVQYKEKTASYDITVFEKENDAALVNDEKELLLAVKNLSSVKLNNDIILSQPILITREIKLNLGNFTLSNENSLWKDGNEDDDVWSLISVKENGKLVISGENGTIKAKENDVYGIDINGGEVTIESGKIVGNVSAIYVFSGTLNINGGEFDISQLSTFADKRYLINCLNKNYQEGSAKVVIKGGKFIGFNPQNNLSQDENEGTNYVAEGFVANETEGGVWEVSANNNNIG